MTSKIQVNALKNELSASDNITLNADGSVTLPTGEKTKSVKYSTLYLKAVVALQEAMERIEALERDVLMLKAGK